MSTNRSPEVRPLGTLLGGGVATVNAIAFVGAFHLAAGCVDGTVRIYDLLSQAAITTMTPAHGSSVLSLSSMQRGIHLLSAEKDGVYCVWDMNRMGDAPVYRAESGAGHFCNSSADKFERDPNCFCTPSVEESSVLMWDTRSRNPCLAIRSGSGWTKGMVTSLLYLSSDDSDSSGPSSSSTITIIEEINTDKLCTKFAPISKILAGFESGDIFDIDLRFPRFDPTRMITTGTASPILSMDVFSDSKKLISGGGDHRLAVSTSTNECLGASCAPQFETNLLPLRSAGTSAVKLRCDDRIFVTGHWDGSVRIYSTIDSQLKAILRHHRESVFAVAFATEANTLPFIESSRDIDPRGVFATAGKGGVIALWDVFADKLKTKT